MELMGTNLPEENHSYPIITGDYDAQQATWSRVDVVPGTKLEKPSR